ncbi:biotin holocarboxylase synthetase [Thoreauomyces humboldtii]|nr:biotin holocarboxylase synthetase [Thoreauomyces humboldtii]
MNVLVYTGPGTARGPVEQTLLTLRSLLSSNYDVIPIDAAGLLTEPWQQTTACLVIPGGRDLPYVKHLQPHGTILVDRYVRAGGRYLGICAGAYFASRTVEFEVHREDYKVVGDRELRFWPGRARGSITEGFVYDSEKGARAVEVVRDASFPGTGGDAPMSLYVNGGPWFEPSEDKGQGSTVRTLAWYAPSVATPPRSAIVECDVGSGRAILSGPHFEYQLNSQTQDPDLARLAPLLAASDAMRLSLTRDILSRLGLKVNDDEDARAAREDLECPQISPMHLCCDASGEANVERLVGGLGGYGIVKDTVNIITFQPAQNLHHSQSTGEHNVDISVYSPDTFPDSLTTPRFDVRRYFETLSRLRKENPAAVSTGFGSVLLYSEVIASTQTLLEKNMTFSSNLPNGFVCTATHQVAGRGRGRNSWISQRGCLQFSFSLEHRDASSAIFVQYLAGLAIIEAIRSKPGCEDLPIHLKWPNDIYARAEPGPGGLKKIGGILVTSSYQGGAFRMVVGCGLNVTNPHPTTSVSEIIQRHLAGKGDATVDGEEVLARIMVRFDQMYQEFASPSVGKDRFRFAFEPFLDRYYHVWLHSNQLVTLQDLGNVSARIVGIDSSGLLRATTTDAGDGGCDNDDIGGVEHLLQPDGNSFDMMKGLISQKK